MEKSFFFAAANTKRMRRDMQKRKKNEIKTTKEGDKKINKLCKQKK